MRVVCVHGIGKQLLGERTLLKEWLPALQDGIARVGAVGAVRDSEVGMAFYGELFRPVGLRLDVGDPPYTSTDVEDGLERELLLAWWVEAARVDRQVVPSDADSLVRVPGSAQTALRALSRSRFFANVALRAMVSDLKQVRRYLTEPVLRADVRRRVLRLIDEDTRVVVGHSLGSVVAYEVLCEFAATGARSGIHLVTMGSPLGIPNLVFDRLDPAPRHGVGAWPCPGDGAWTNIVDAGDVVALVKDLRPRFGQEVNGFEVHNDVHAHDAGPYLTDAVTGRAIADALQ